MPVKIDEEIQPCCVGDADLSLTIIMRSLSVDPPHPPPPAFLLLVFDGRHSHVVKIVIKIFLFQLKFTVVTCPGGHRRVVLRCRAPVRQDAVIDSNHAVRVAGYAGPVNIQHIVFGVDTPDLVTEEGMCRRRTRTEDSYLVTGF